MDSGSERRVFSYVSTESQLEVMDESATTFLVTNVFQLRSEIPSRFFVWSFIWTGTDYDDVAELDCAFDGWGEPLQRIHGPVIREGRSRRVVVDLGRTVEAGELTEVRLRHHLRDFGGTFQPLHGYRARSGNERAALAVRLPARLAGSVTFRARRTGADQDDQVEAMAGTPLKSGSVEFSWSESRPSLADGGRLYYISWGQVEMPPLR